MISVVKTSKYNYVWYKKYIIQRTLTWCTNFKVCLLKNELLKKPLPALESVPTTFQLRCVFLPRHNLPCDGWNLSDRSIWPYLLPAAQHTRRYLIEVTLVKNNITSSLSMCLYYSTTHPGPPIWISFVYCSCDYKYSLAKAPQWYLQCLKDHLTNDIGISGDKIGFWSLKNISS